MTFLNLFIEFFKAGLFAVGGGLATIPFLQDIARRYDWFTEAELTDMIAVSESTPGPIGVNMATYAGYKAGLSVGGVPTGILGGIGADDPDCKYELSGITEESFDKIYERRLG